MDHLISDLGFMSLGGATPKKQKKASWSYPEFDSLITNEVPEVSWYAAVDGKGYIQEYDTKIMGSFQCTNDKCNKKKWTSKRIPITIRLYPNNEYNAIVYRQRCKGCERLGVMEIDIETYTERVVYRLKKWLGYDVEPPEYSGLAKQTAPHESLLCEGCKVGHCSAVGLEGS